MRLMIVASRLQGVKDILRTTGTSPVGTLGAEHVCSDDKPRGDAGIGVRYAAVTSSGGQMCSNGKF